MKKIFYWLVFLSSYLIAQTGYVPKFELIKNEIELTRVAQPHQYLDKIGRKAALMGFENGSFEMWIWPWKPLRSFDLQFFTGSSTLPLLSKDIVRTISVTPEATVITYTHESFSVKEIIYIPVEEPGAVILLDIKTIEPLTVVPGFIPVMQPQWPAGIGGQYSYWDDNMKAYIISESQQRGLFLCGSPLGKQMSAPPAHMFADNPLQFKIEVKPEDADNGYIPIIIAGSPVKTKYDSVKTIYNSLLQNASDLYKRNYEYYKQLKENTIRIKTPNEKINLAFEWGKTALHNLMVDNPALGKGLVAGYGLSGNGGRPGFAWFFGGDAFANSLSFNSFQDFNTVRDALKFTQKWQRQDNFPIRKKKPEDVNKDIGKMAHELSQSDGIADWWNDYHYGYNHADTTPWYLLSIGDYYMNSGDIGFIKESWKSIKQAFEWCKSRDSDNDGLMDLKGAGLGVLEFGSLVKIHNDLYTQAIYAKGLQHLVQMAKGAGDNAVEKEAEELYKKSIPALEKIYWMDDLGFYSFGANEEKEQVREKSIYSSSAIMLNLMDKERSESTIENFSASDMCTDWGIRNLSNKSELYHPSNYNYGTVWPFTSTIINTAQYNCYYNLTGYKTLLATVNHIFDNGLGVSPEVFSGAINQKLGEAYHDQGFSISGFMVPIARGLLGIEVDAVNKIVYFKPQIPADWDNVTVSNIKVLSSRLDINLTKEKGKIRLNISKNGNDDLTFNFSPVLAPGSKQINALLNNNKAEVKEEKTSQAVIFTSSFGLTGKDNFELNFNAVPEIYIIPVETPIGASNHSLKIISQKYEENVLRIKTEGIPGNQYELGLTNFENVDSVEGAELKEGKLLINIPGKEQNEFINHTIEIKVKSSL